MEIPNHIEEKIKEYPKEIQEKIRDFFKSQGIYKIKNGLCEKGKTNPVDCMFCDVGHITECHYNLDCKTANCSHYQRTIYEKKNMRIE